MGEEAHVEGYEGYTKFVESYKDKKKPLYLLFTGSKAPNGSSWCPDCVTADPVIKECLKGADDIVLLHVAVGPREVWKDPKNPFRTDEKLKIRCVPTLMKLGKPQRLEEMQCADPGLVSMLFDD